MYRYRENTAKQINSRIIQLVNKFAIDPKTENDAVNKRKSGNNYRRKCMATAQVQIGGNWQAKVTGESQGGTGPQQHAERDAIGNAIGQSIMAANNTNLANYNGNLNTQQGNVAGTTLHNAGVTDIDVYTELPPCWGCDPWLNGVESQISGNISSRYSSFLTRYYDDYQGLSNINIQGPNYNTSGTNLLFDYHIGYVIDNINYMQNAGALLNTNNYAPPFWNSLRPPGLPDMQTFSVELRNIVNDTRQSMYNKIAGYGHLDHNGIISELTTYFQPIIDEYNRIKDFNPATMDEHENIITSFHEFSSDKISSLALMGETG